MERAQEKRIPNRPRSCMCASCRHLSTAARAMARHGCLQTQTHLHMHAVSEVDSSHDTQALRDDPTVRRINDESQNRLLLVIPTFAHTVDVAEAKTNDHIQNRSESLACMPNAADENARSRLPRRSFWDEQRQHASLYCRSISFRDTGLMLCSASFAWP